MKGYEFRIEINNQFRDNSLNSIFNKDMEVQRCSQVNENSFVRFYSVNSEKDQKTSIGDRYPLYNFGEQSDWNFYTKWLNSQDPNLKYLPSSADAGAKASPNGAEVEEALKTQASKFNLRLIKDIFKLNRPLSYNIRGNPNLIHKSVDVRRFISKSNKDLANEVVVIAENFSEATQRCRIDVLLTFSEYPVFSKLSVESSQTEKKKYKWNHTKLDFMRPIFRRPYHNISFEIEILKSEEVRLVLPYGIFFRNFEEIEHEFERGVFLPGVPYHCQATDEKDSRGKLVVRNEDLIETVRTAPFVLVQEKLLDNTFVFTSLTFGTAFMYLLYVTFSFATMMQK